MVQLQLDLNWQFFQLMSGNWDMYHEKCGFMLIFWNMAGVPFTYCHSALYLAKYAPSEYRWNRVALTLLYVSYLFVYWVWDSCNGQKNRFRQSERGTLTYRKTYPQVPWTTLENPNTIKTKTGDSILVDGWYKYARKIHYTCDLYFVSRLYTNVLRVEYVHSILTSFRRLSHGAS